MRFVPGITIQLFSLTLFLSTQPCFAGCYTLSLHDALPISPSRPSSPICAWLCDGSWDGCRPVSARHSVASPRSEEHTSELQSRGHLVCRLLLEKKKHRT